MHAFARATKRRARSTLARLLPLLALASCAPAGPDGTVASAHALSQVESVRSRIGAGERHSCFLSLEGQLYCWGTNDLLQLGTDEVSETDIAIAVRTPEPFVHLAVGNDHSCALTADGSAYCWGRNEEGQLGRGRPGGAGLIEPVVGDHRFRSLAAGANHTCGITVTGEMFCWGLDDSGQIAVGAERVQGSPEYADVDDAVQLALGAEHTCALQSSGRLECWGGNTHGQLGSKDEFASHPWPLQVMDEDGFELRDAVDIAAGARFTCALRANSEIWCWGEGMDPDYRVSPPAPRDGAHAVYTYIGHAELLWGGTGDHYCRRKYGSASCTGPNDSGQLAEQDRHKTVGYPRLSGIFQLATGVRHTCAVDDTERVYCWGRNAERQLGIAGAPDDFPSPLPVLGLPTSPGGSTRAGAGDTLGLGARATCATRSDGNLYCWGGNRYSTLGVDPAIYSVAAPDRPVSVAWDPSGTVRLREVTMGGDFACALSTHASVWCWGRNDRGQLGRNDPPGTFTCTTCMTAEHVFLGSPGYYAVSAGEAFACAVAATGTVVCWGANDVGQLGNGTYVDSRIPTDTGLRGARRIATGRRHGCALEPLGGIVSCWGDNSEGQAGSGDFVSVNWARQVSGEFIDLAAGDTHTCALDTDGNVWCWGSGRFGQLGDGTGPFNPPPSGGYRASASPVRVDQSRSGPAVAIAASERNTCLLNSFGEVFCWGDNEFGQLGNGTASTLSGARTPTTPVIASSMGMVRQLRLGGRHACATNVFGETWCWGSDSTFQLGRGVYPDRYSAEPARVAWP